LRQLKFKNEAAADRYHHQLHPKPWAKSPEEAAWALMQRITGSWPMGSLMVWRFLRSKKGEQYNVSLLRLSKDRNFSTYAVIRVTLNPVLLQP
jgi:hypothetical protein